MPTPTRSVRLGFVDLGSELNRTINLGHMFSVLAVLRGFKTLFNNKFE
jgi:hypothetical protein